MDVARLIACGIGQTQAKAFAEPLTRACDRFGIITPVRQASFLAQVLHESTGLTAIEESLFYRSPERIRAVWPSRFVTTGDAAKFVRSPQALANHVYAGRNGNGDEASGDGWRFRGSGPLQLTGRANFRLAGQGCKQDFEGFPDLVRQPAGGCMAAAWFFSHAGCLQLADGAQTDAITRLINGPAMLGASERRNHFRECLEALQ